MVEQEFGGRWTQVKLGCLGKYLSAYRQIFTANEKARYFTTWYVDAFAGTGSRVNAKTPKELGLFEDVYQDEDRTGYLDGSATIALGLPKPFDHYLFIEKSKARVSKLRTSIEIDYTELVSRCDLRHGDANDVLKKWCQERDWKKERAVVFLDPFGMQVEWSTVVALAETKAVDLWYLFPLGVGVARLLRHDGKIEETWQRRLDLLFGTGDWRSIFYQVETTRDLFGDTETVSRNVTVEAIESFIHKRLVMLFEGVAQGRVLRNSKSSPLYLLCFAAANKRAARTALNIAQDILDD